MRALSGGKLRLVSKIASGGMGDVYLARNEVTGADVAVKLLEPSLAGEPDVALRFRHEAHVSALLSHRSIVRVFDLLEEPDGALALVMERLRGETVEQRLRRGPLEPAEAVAVIAPILVALEHAHAVGVVHRDVKPANVLLAVEPDGRVTPKLLDFGVAKAAVSSVKTIDGRVLGTARYMSPEQVRGETLDGRSDVFSCAVVLYETLTGESPFAAPDAAGAIARVLETTVDPHERIPPRLWLEIDRALSKQAYARHPGAAAFASAIAQAVGKTDEELSALLREAKPPLPKLETRGELRPMVAPSSPPPRPSRTPWLIVAAFVLGASATAVITARRASPAAEPLGGPEGTPPATSSAPAAPSAAASTAAVARIAAAPASASAVAEAGVTAHRPAASSRHSHAAPAPPRGAKPVATTPGF